MPEISFDCEWIDGEGIAGPELAATWASLRIFVRDSSITYILDHREKAVRDSVYVPLYPLAEWLATNWWFLSNEFRNPHKEGDLEFARRHSLSANREGYALPKLEVVSSGTSTGLTWKRYLPQWTRVEFLSEGRASIDRLGFMHACAELIDKVIERLNSRAVEDTFLHREWAAIQATEDDEEELKFCEIAAGLGLDPYDLDDPTREAILLLAGELGEYTEEAVQVLDSSLLQIQSAAILSAIEDARKSPLALVNVVDVHLGRQEMSARPWDVGYGWARAVRRELDLDGQPLTNMETFADALGVEEGSLSQAMQSVDKLAGAPLVDGLVAVNDDRTASFALRHSGEQSRRFSFCRALAEYLTSHESGALVTQSHSERQQRSRAFAAEFLAPSAQLRERVTRLVINSDEVDELAHEFGVSWLAIKHQLENHGIAQVSEPILN